MTKLALKACFLGSCIRVAAGRAGGQIRPGSTIRITDTEDPVKKRYARISGDIVVWEDHRSGQAEIYGHDLATGQEFPIATGGLAKHSPQIDGSLVIWEEHRTGWDRRLYCKDLDTGVVHTVDFGVKEADSWYAAIDRKVYYSAQRGYYEEQHIYCYDLDTGQRTRVSPETGNWHRYPQGKDDHVVWSAYGSLGILDVRTGAVALVPSADLGVFVEHVAVAQGTACFLPDYPSSELIAYDIPGQQLTRFALRGSNIGPRADGTMVTVTDPYPAACVRGLDLSTGQQFDVVALEAGQILGWENDIDDMRVVWVRIWNNDFEDTDIFLTTLVPEPATLSLLVLGGLTLMHRRKR